MLHAGHHPDPPMTRDQSLVGSPLLEFFRGTAGRECPALLSWPLSVSLSVCGLSLPSVWSPTETLQEIMCLWGSCPAHTHTHTPSHRPNGVTRTEPAQRGTAHAM